jgi:MFS family permease
MPQTPTANTAGKSIKEKLSRSALIIGLVSLLSDASSEMIYPVLPIFLTQFLHAPATVIGLIEGVTNGIANIVPIISGWLSDRLERRKSIAFVGFLLSALSRPVIGLASVWTVAFAARGADRIGKGIRSAPKQALLAEAASDSQRGRVFGYDRAMDYLGSVIGPLICLALVGGLGVSVRNIFFIASVPAFLAALMILAVREPRDAAKAEIKGSSFKGLTRQFKLFLIVAAVFGLGNSANSFLILRAQELGLATTWTILAYALFNAVSSLFSMPAGTASDKFGRRNMLLIGYAIYALVYLGFGAANQVWMMWPLFALYGLFPAFADGATKALAVDTAGTAGRATAIGIFSAVNGITQIAASYIGGALWDRINSQATFYFGAILSTLAVVLLFLLLPSRMETKQTDGRI